MIKTSKCLAVLSLWLALPAVSCAQDAAAYQRSFKSPDPAARMSAAQEAGNKGAAAAVPGLIALLKDRSHSVRVNAVVALGQIRDPRAVAPLMEAVEKSTFTAVRIMAAQALGNFPEERVIALLVKAADDKLPAVRAAACRSLGKVGGSNETDKLAEKAASDSDGQVRKTALAALGEIAEVKDLGARRSGVERALESAVTDPDEAVKRSAEAALKKLRKEK